jgi:pimeloyl-ACP methyl ester carboxylesterase
MQLIKAFFKISDRFFPSLAARTMYTLMTNPRIRKLRAFEEEILDAAERKCIPFKGFEIQTYEWGATNSRTVLMIHGWEGQAGNFGAFVNDLLAKGYRLISYDAPAHGRSSKGKTNMFDIADLAGQLLAEHQPEFIISHSFGSVITAMSLKKNPTIFVKDWIMITTPYQYINYIKGVTEFFNLSPKTFKKVIDLVEAQVDEPIENLNMATYCAALENIERATIIHSVEDKVIPIDSARQTHAGFPKSQLIELNDLGHYGILWSDQTKTIVNQIIA